MNYILVAGYGWSGSSALVDMLKEYDNCYEADIEFRLIKDPKGLRDLYDSIITKWDALNVDIALRDFRWFAKHLNARRSKYTLFSGLGYYDFFGPNFINATNQFLSEIVEFDYSSHWFYLDFMCSRVQLLNHRIKRKLKTDKSVMEFSAISEENFISASNKYINNIFNSIIDSSKYDSIVLDQAVSAQNCLEEMRFIPNSKLIIGDIYSDLMKDGNLLGKELQISHDVGKYVQWHRALRKSKERWQDNRNILTIHFEDLIQDYDKTEKMIEAFLGLNHSKHTNRMKYFNPDASRKNTGIWKTVLSSEEMQILERELITDFVK